MRTLKIHLIRHGATDANYDGRYIGCKTDLPLAPEGLNELRLLKDDIAYHEIERLLDQIVTEDERFGYLIENLLCNTRMPRGTASCKEHLFNLLKAKLTKYKD